ncbi:MAG: 6-phosphofructokinase [Bdellovibrionales bacterium CG10_big_fil_rev_8_21_14_0_10_45_34]|nr:MAG: 6-phosphofructokinase [Bdellovibrionales bacterium CG10_big_fil_rev_8_21_14_0_10_45_34]
MTNQASSSIQTFDPNNLKKIGIFTSGGDAPGMNAALRSAVRSAIHRGLQVDGILQGYNGMIKEEFEPLNLRSMANIIQRGGTILRTGRSQEFLKPEVRAAAVQGLKKRKIDALVCIGGDGSFRGAHALWNEHSMPVVGIPGTIDNDIFGTDLTVGFDTAVNTALDAIDRIRDTAASHDRLFIVEVMGRDSGFIAVEVGIAGGAEEVFVPETECDLDKTILRLKQASTRGKLSSILVAAEGPTPGRAYKIAEEILAKSGLDAKVCILGHVQRGGAPTALDRNLATRLGGAAIDALLNGYCDAMAGMQAGEVNIVPFTTVYSQKKRVPDDLLKLLEIVSS